jgi:ATP-dependent helicase/nuclease subunit A
VPEPVPELWALERSAVVQAGAGTGKTHSLVTLCLHLLGGIGRAEALLPSRLCAVTFTEKAAAELQGRLRQRVDDLAQSHGAEPDLLASCAALGTTPPAAAHWQRVRGALGLAQVGTIHGLCAQILRRHAAEAGVDPSFALLDEADGPRLLRKSCEDAALQSLEGLLGPDHTAAAKRLCAEFGFRGGGKFGSGLADELRSLVIALGETGGDPAALVEGTRGLRRGAAEEQFTAAKDAVAAALAALDQTVRERGPVGVSGVAAADALAEFHARGRAALAGAAPGALALSWPLLRLTRARLIKRGSGLLPDAIGVAAAAIDGLCEAEAGVRACGLARDLALLTRAAIDRYRAAKARAAALDFDDLTRLARDLLVGDETVRRYERARFGVVLVDEFQDTSRTQLQLFEALTGTQPLVVVGDRKQSIYEFRGADVAGAQAFAARLLDGGAISHVLRESRRSRPALVEFANLLFTEALAAKDRPFDTPFRPGQDALTAFRDPGEPGPCAELLDISGPGVEAEAEAVARRIAAVLAPGAPERVYDGEVPRPVRGGDIAILLRRFSNVEAFRRALLARRIPHLIFRGRGFHQAREVIDLLALLALAIDPDDALALAAVLRSPLGPVSDDGLVLLAQGHGLGRRSLTDPSALQALADDDREAVERLAHLLAQLQREADRLGPAALLEALLAETDYVAACAGGLYGEQAAANLDKLVGQARAHELQGGNVRSFLQRMQDLRDEEDGEPDAAVVEERDPHAVRILTVHAAKGLEFPVVCIPECATRSAQSTAVNVLLEAGLGLAVKTRGVDGERRWGPHGLAVKERKLEREVAQSRRLFYVAVTRARDLVILSGREAGRAESWRGWVDQVSAAASARGLLRTLRDGGPRVPAAPGQRAAIDGAEALLQAVLEARPSPVSRASPEARALVARAIGEVGPGLASVSVPVTQLADAAACPRRYQLLHELGLEERPDPEPLREASLEDAPPTALGTLAHRLLELVPLGLPPTARREELDRLLRLEGHDPLLLSGLADTAADFLDTPLGLRMARAKGDRLQRELPFVLRLAPEDDGPELLIRGQLDALLLDDGAATVVDYKLSRARDVEHYARQLDAYALAAHELVQGAVPVRTGVVFLRSPGAPFAERAAADADGMARIRERLLQAGRALADGRRSGVWPGIPAVDCRELGCGFLRRCHPEPQ